MYIMNAEMGTIVTPAVPWQMSVPQKWIPLFLRDQRTIGGYLIALSYQLSTCSILTYIHYVIVRVSFNGSRGIIDQL